IKPVLRGVNLHVGRGEVVALLGPNGMGKTTLLAAMAGVLSPQKGYVEIDGMRRRRSVEEERTLRKNVVYLPDHPWVPLSRTGREFLLSVGRLYDLDSERLMDHVDRLLRLFDLAANADAPIRSYSSGQQKKIVIAAILVSEAPVLLLDEPFSGGLDPAAIFALKHVLQQLANQAGFTVVLSTPIAELAESLAHRIAVLQDGEITAYNTADNLRRQADRPGSLGEVLETMTHPHTVENIRYYFEGRNL
ncbi:MAG: ABC transporter ATP-binding protein, partial [Planctomycetes bacterium]|nr:ABC transporter ATP-binding protein [Planctomycetota bacterium]